MRRAVDTCAIPYITQDAAWETHREDLENWVASAEPAEWERVLRYIVHVSRKRSKKRMTGWYNLWRCAMAAPKERLNLLVEHTEKEYGTISAERCFVFGSGHGVGKFRDELATHECRSFFGIVAVFGTAEHMTRYLELNDQWNSIDMPSQMIYRILTHGLYQYVKSDYVEKMNLISGRMVAWCIHMKAPNAHTHISPMAAALYFGNRQTIKVLIEQGYAVLTDTSVPALLGDLISRDPARYDKALALLKEFLSEPAMSELIRQAHNAEMIRQLEVNLWDKNVDLQAVADRALEQVRQGTFNDLELLVLFSRLCRRSPVSGMDSLFLHAHELVDYLLPRFEKIPFADMESIRERIIEMTMFGLMNGAKGTDKTALLERLYRWFGSVDLSRVLNISTGSFGLAESPEAILRILAENVPDGVRFTITEKALPQDTERIFFGGINGPTLKKLAESPLLQFEYTGDRESLLRGLKAVLESESGDCTDNLQVFRRWGLLNELTGTELYELAMIDISPTARCTLLNMANGQKDSDEYSFD